MAKMEVVASSSPIDFSYLDMGDEWGSFAPHILKDVGTIIMDALACESPDLYLPFEFGPKSDGIWGTGVSDPLAVYVTLPFSNTDDENAKFYVSCSFRDAAMQMLDCRQVSSDQKIALADAEFAPEFIAALRDLADEMEAMIEIE